MVVQKISLVFPVPGSEHIDYHSSCNIKHTRQIRVLKVAFYTQRFVCLPTPACSAGGNTGLQLCGDGPRPQQTLGSNSPFAFHRSLPLLLFQRPVPTSDCFQLVLTFGVIGFFNCTSVCFFFFFIRRADIYILWADFCHDFYILLIFLLLYNNG